MRWQQEYRSKLTSAHQALAGLRPGAKLYISGNSATPRHLAEVLAEVAPTEGAVSLGHVLLLGTDPVATRHHPHVRHHAWFVGPADREQVNNGQADYVPCHLSEIPRLIRRTDDLDMALLTVSPPDQHGFLSLGTEVIASLAAVDAAKKVVVQVNRHMPRVLGNSFIHVDQVDAIVECDEPLAELAPREPTEVEKRIAEHIVPLVPRGATMQLGIGGVPDAVIALLCEQDANLNLGIHSEMISDGVMNAVERGLITGSMKKKHHRKVVTTFVLGSRQLYDWVHDNSRVEAHPCDHTNHIKVASANPNLVALNSAVSVDLTGQVCSDSMGTRIYSGFGGQVDFIRAASLSEGGVPILALPSTAKKGTISRIVPTLATGSGVVTSRADVHWVVTEHGAVNLYGRSLRERARLLVSIAAPEFRDDLMEQLAAPAK
mgnify:CR=1 FL=1